MAVPPDGTTWCAKSSGCHRRRFKILRGQSHRRRFHRRAFKNLWRHGRVADNTMLAYEFLRVLTSHVVMLKRNVVDPLLLGG